MKQVFDHELREPNLTFEEGEEPIFDGLVDFSDDDSDESSSEVVDAEVQVNMDEEEREALQKKHFKKVICSAVYLTAVTLIVYELSLVRWH